MTAGVAALLVGGLVAGCGSSSSKSSSPSSAPSSAASSDSASGSGPTAADLSGVLLSADEVGTVAQGTFTATPSKDDATTTKSGCTALDDFTVAAKGSEKAKAGNDYNTSDQSQTASEELDYVPAKAEPLFTTLKNALSDCKGFSAGGTQLTLTTLPDPKIDGSDDTVAAQASGTVQGQTITLDISLARFGDTVLSVTYGGGVEKTNADTVTQSLLEKAATKAKGVL